MLKLTTLDQTSRFVSDTLRTGGWACQTLAAALFTVFRQQWEQWWIRMLQEVWSGLLWFIVVKIAMFTSYHQCTNYKKKRCDRLMKQAYWSQFWVTSRTCIVMACICRSFQVCHDCWLENHSAAAAELNQFATFGSSCNELIHSGWPRVPWQHDIIYSIHTLILGDFEQWWHISILVPQLGQHWRIERADFWYS